MPKRTGVYYFHDIKGKIIYIGKAVNIKQRVASHFALNSESRSKSFFLNEVHSISFRETGSEIAALLLESQEIKQHWPAYNLAQKGPLTRFGIYQYTDQNNYQRLGILKEKRNYKPVISFPTLREARDFLSLLVKEHELCPKLAGLQHSAGSCYDYTIDSCRGACVKEESSPKYNMRHDAAIDTLISGRRTFTIVDNGRHGGERSLVLVENGKLKGWGFIKRDTPVNDLELLRPYTSPFMETEISRSLLESYILANPSNVHYFNSGPGFSSVSEEVKTGLFEYV